MALLRVGPLPAEALAAAARFHDEVLPEVRRSLAAAPSQFTLIFPIADHTHSAWRLAAVQGFAREFAPIRINAVASDDELAIAAAVSYLEEAEGVTGQVLSLDGHGAGKVISSAA